MGPLRVGRDLLMNPQIHPWGGQESHPVPHLRVLLPYWIPLPHRGPLTKSHPLGQITPPLQQIPEGESFLSSPYPQQNRDSLLMESTLPPHQISGKNFLQKILLTEYLCTYNRFQAPLMACPTPTGESQMPHD